MIVFNSLSKEDIATIIDIELQGLLNRLHELGLQLHISEVAKEFLVEQGYDSQYGARPLKRAIQKFLEDELAEMVIKGTFSEGSSLLVNYEQGNDRLTIQEKIS